MLLLRRLYPEVIRDRSKAFKTVKETVEESLEKPA